MMHLPLGAREIRLLSISPESDSHAPVYCSLQSVSLDQKPSYATLSYAWGHDKLYRRIIVDGANFKVSRTVHRALRHLRSLHVGRVWIDQICIDQSNVLERNQQISLISSIYRWADECFVYLCERPLNLNDISEVQRHVRRCRHHMLSVEKPLDSTVQQLRGGFLQEGTDELAEIFSYLRADNSWLRGIEYIIKQPYFQRTWPLQEIVFSPKITCIIGNQQLPWDTIRALAVDVPMALGFSTNNAARRALPLSELPEFGLPWSESKSRDKTNDLQAAQSLEAFNRFVTITETRGRGDLLSLLRLARNLKTTDPRDKIFALLNIATDAHRYPPADYRLSTEAVYHQFAAAIAHHHDGFELLATGNPYSITRQPSWVTRWDKSAPGFIWETHTQFSAGGNRSARARYHEGRFYVKAFPYDVVEYKSSALQVHGNLFCEAAKFVDMVGHDISERRIELGIGVITKSLIKLLLCDPEINGAKMFKREAPTLLPLFQQPAYIRRCDEKVSNLTESQKIFTQRIRRSNYLGDSINELNSGFEQIFDYFSQQDAYRKIQNNILNVNISKTEDALRRLTKRNIDDRGLDYLEYLQGKNMPLCVIALRTSGYKGSKILKPFSLRHIFGLAPAVCRRGDVVMIIKGARAPFIFRRVGENQYRNMGQAYIREMMQGEIVDKLYRDDWRYVEVV